MNCISHPGEGSIENFGQCERRMSGCYELWTEAFFRSVLLRSWQRGSQYQGGYFGKKFWSCRPDAGPEQLFGGFAGRTPVRRRFAGFAGIPKFPGSPDSPIFRNSPIFQISRKFCGLRIPESGASLIDFVQIVTLASLISQN